MAGIVLGLLRLVQQVFCAGSNNNEEQQHQNQQHQQQQHQQQQNQQYNNQYPPIQKPTYAGATGQHQNNHNQHNNQHNNQHVNQHNNNFDNNHQGNQNGYPGGNHQQQQHTQPHQSFPGIITSPHSLPSSNPQYLSLRQRAQDLGNQSHTCFARSQQAYQNGDKEGAHELSMEGKRLGAEKERLDDEAGEWIYNENNRNRPQGEIDLHGLYVKEAIERVDAALNQARANNMDELRIIVGKGIHSQNHIAKIKPAVEDLMVKYGLSAHVDPENTGVIIVDMQGREVYGRTRDAGAVVGEMQGKMGGDCVIM